MHLIEFARFTDDGCVINNRAVRMCTYVQRCKEMKNGQAKWRVLQKSN